MQNIVSNSPIMAEHIELWPLDRLSVYERNPRFHSELQIERVNLVGDKVRIR